MADEKDGTYLIYILGFKGYKHTSDKPDDHTRRVLPTNAQTDALAERLAKVDEMQQRIFQKVEIKCLPRLPIGPSLGADK
jgi:hypothetical protein